MKHPSLHQSFPAPKDIESLEDALSAPTPGVIETMRQLNGDVIVLGVGGKMGPTIARMLKRASVEAGVKRKVVGVSRFSDDSLRQRLNDQDIETIVCDLMEPDQIAAVPEAPNVVFMAGMKFGATGREAYTWAVNSYLPALVCRRFRDSRIVAFSTGNVYPLTSVGAGGCRETDPVEPVGEYAMSCVGRERIFEYFSETQGNRVSIVRLSYAVELRYGVLMDIAVKVLEQEPIDLNMGNVVAIWQGDANALAIQSFLHADSPPFKVNVTGPEVLSVRQIAEEFATRFRCEVNFVGQESGLGLISSTAMANGLFGYPTVPISRVIGWCAEWIAAGGHTLGKPTRFEAMDGRF